MYNNNHSMYMNQMNLKDYINIYDPSLYFYQPYSMMVHPPPVAYYPEVQFVQPTGYNFINNNPSMYINVPTMNQQPFDELNYYNQTSIYYHMGNIDPINQFDSISTTFIPVQMVPTSFIETAPVHQTVSQVNIPQPPSQQRKSHLKNQPALQNIQFSEQRSEQYFDETQESNYPPSYRHQLSRTKINTNSNFHRKWKQRANIPHSSNNDIDSDENKFEMILKSSQICKSKESQKFEPVAKYLSRQRYSSCKKNIESRLDTPVIENVYNIPPLCNKNSEKSTSTNDEYQDKVLINVSNDLNEDFDEFFNLKVTELKYSNLHITHLNDLFLNFEENKENPHCNQQTLSKAESCNNNESKCSEQESQKTLNKSPKQKQEIETQLPKILSEVMISYDEEDIDENNQPSIGSQEDPKSVYSPVKVSSSNCEHKTNFSSLKSNFIKKLPSNKSSFRDQKTFLHRTRSFHNSSHLDNIQLREYKAGHFNGHNGYARSPMNNRSSYAFHMSSNNTRSKNQSNNYTRYQNINGKNFNKHFYDSRYD